MYRPIETSDEGVRARERRYRDPGIGASSLEPMDNTPHASITEILSCWSKCAE